MTHYIGIDVSKIRLDVDWLGTAKEFSNEENSIQLLIEQLKTQYQEGNLKLVLCEATGGYEQKLVRACHEAKLPIHVAHANKVKYFAKSKGLKAKTDQIDARTLTDYGSSFQPLPDSLLLSGSLKKVADLLKRREQLQADKKRETNRSDKDLDADVQQSVDDHVEWLSGQIKIIDKKLSSLKQEKDVVIKHNLLTSIPYIGDISAHYLLSNLPELGVLPHKSLSALVGVAPFNNDSGKSENKRFIKGGRSCLRQVLYMAAISAIRYNPPLKLFYDRLREKGKSGRVALIAVVRKLIGMANSVLKRGTAWTPEYLPV
jgi:transposase